MKFEFNESEYATEITLSPETAEETAQVLRMMHNTKSKKPVLYFSFTGNNPWAMVTLKKIKGNTVVTTMSND